MVTIAQEKGPKGKRDSDGSSWPQRDGDTRGYSDRALASSRGRAAFTVTRTYDRGLAKPEHKILREEMR